MNKALSLIISFLFVACRVFAQDTAWKKIVVDNNLTVSLPPATVTIDTSFEKNNVTADMRIIKASADYSTIGITVTKAGLESVDNPESMDEAYKGVEEGFRNSARAKGFNTTFSDTLFEDIKGKKAMMYKDAGGNHYRVYYYMFILNSNMYGIMASPNGEESEGSRKELKRLLTSFHFTAKTINEKKFNSKAESLGYKIGEIIGYLIAMGVCILAVYLFVRYLTRPKKQNRPS